MSKSTYTLTRRTFLKGTTYASALSIGGLAGLVAANTGTATQNSSKPDRTGTGGLLAITLSNQSDKTIALNPQQPVSLEQVNGWVVVKINKATTADTVATATGQHIHLAAGQACSFAVDAELAPALAAGSADIVITNEYSTLDNMVPVTPYHAMAA